MSRNSVSLPPFPAGYRASGLLLHVTSLPSPYGIGDVGPAALLRAMTKDSNRSGALLNPHTGKMLEAVSRT